VLFVGYDVASFSFFSMTLCTTDTSRAMIEHLPILIVRDKLLFSLKKKW
jgi:hypothetical protein